MQVNVGSEIGKLEGVIIHKPGAEVENMTPRNAQRALYSDILNLNVASKEYSEFHETLKKLTKVFLVDDLLNETLQNENAKNSLLTRICQNENVESICEDLLPLDNAMLSKFLIEGLPMKKDTLTKYLSSERYSFLPLHNFFFMRDPAVCFNNSVIISKMASTVREREALIMETIFSYHPEFQTELVIPEHKNNFQDGISIEGGDVLIAREDVLLIGIGARTTSLGIDFLLEKLKEKRKNYTIIVQEIPRTPESFIHLDMVFTFLDSDKCMIYEPVILNPHDFQTLSIKIEEGKVISIKETANLMVALRQEGIDLEPLNCGGDTDEWIQEREQWHSGANFFAIAPGKVIGYGRNIHTVEELNKNGFEVLTAKDVIAGKVNPDTYKRAVITIEGSELSRGGGGCRCMSMPVKRESVNW